MPGFEYPSAQLGSNVSYNPSRERSPLATSVVRAFSAAVGSVVVTRAFDCDELFERYDRKLWSYQDNLARFTMATIPSVVALAAIYIGFRGIKGLRVALSL